MLKGWRIWAVLCVFLTAVAEGMNHVTPDLEFLQWLLFVLAVVCFVIGITNWDRGTGGGVGGDVKGMITSNSPRF